MRNLADCAPGARGVKETTAMQSETGSMRPQRVASTLKSFCELAPSATIPEMTNGLSAALLSVTTFADGVPTS